VCTQYLRYVILKNIFGGIKHPNQSTNQTNKQINKVKPEVGILQHHFFPIHGAGGSFSLPRQAWSKRGRPFVPRGSEAEPLILYIRRVGCCELRKVQAGI
jgi:hypothetical protein